MTISLEKYEKLKKAVDTQQREADRAEGALEQLMEKLNDEFDCSTLKEAKKLSAKLKAEADDAGTEFEGKLSEFIDEWGHILEGSK